MILYTATYRNRGQSAAHNLQATLPIPEGLEYLPTSATPVNAQACTADGRFQTMPLQRTVSGPDGKPHTVVVPFAEYRKLRWAIGELAAGKTVKVTARARVLPAASAAPKP